MLVWAQIGHARIEAMRRKGKVSVERHGNRIRLRWRVAGQRVTLPIGPDYQYVWKQAESIAAQIERDLLTGDYDPTLKKYRGENERPRSIAAVDLFMTSGDSDKHRAIGNHLKSKFGRRGADAISEGEAQDFFDSLTTARSTKSSYLTLLKAAWKKQPENPWISVELGKGCDRAPSEPFSHAEVEAILRGFEGSYYLGFVKGLFGLGCRPGELAALTWADVDFKRGVVEINKAWSDRRRLVKTTKTGKVRKVPLSRGLKEFLLSIRRSEGLVFPGRKGGPINPKDFLCRHWRPTLKKCGVKYRSQYKSRHTVWSHAIAGGMPIAEASQYAGNRPETMMRHYLGAVSRSEMPELI